ncbi:MAG: hypothetical protein ABFS17_07655 [Chloroflexota bacterium]
MFEREKPSTWVRVLLSLALLAVVIGGGYAVYRFGYAHGAIAADSGELLFEDWNAHPMMDQNFYPHGRSFYPRGNIFFGLIVIVLLFGLFRRLVFGPRWARWGYGPHGFHGHPRHPGDDCYGQERKSKTNGEKVPEDEESPE